MKRRELFIKSFASDLRSIDLNIDQRIAEVKLLLSFLRNESGATAIEYSLIATLISLAVIAGSTRLGTKLSSTFNTIANKLSG